LKSIKEAEAPESNSTEASTGGEHGQSNDAFKMGREEGKGIEKKELEGVQDALGSISISSMACWRK
jgi:hypothetical protein